MGMASAKSSTINNDQTDKEESNFKEPLGRPGTSDSGCVCCGCSVPRHRLQLADWHAWPAAASIESFFMQLRLARGSYGCARFQLVVSLVGFSMLSQRCACMHGSGNARGRIWALPDGGGIPRDFALERNRQGCATTACCFACRFSMLSKRCACMRGPAIARGRIWARPDGGGIPRDLASERNQQACATTSAFANLVS